MTYAPPDASILARRREQPCPRLTLAEVDRLRRFGEPRSYKDGERLFAAGEPGSGVFAIGKGAAAVAQPHALLRGGRI
jgi:thioredoxin reductase (NADPH)